MAARPPPEVKLTPQNLQLLFFFLTFILRFRPLLQIFVGVAAPTFCCEDFLLPTATKPPLAIHSRVKLVMHKSRRLILICR